MEHRFLEAERKVNGVVQTTFDSVAGQAVVMGWNIPPENIPKFQPGKCQFILKAAEATVIPSIWKAFGGSVNAGLTSLTSKINGLLGGMEPTAGNQSVDFQQSFRPVKVHTGIKINMPRDEIVILSPSANCYKNGIVLIGDTVLDPDMAGSEISLHFYNILSTDVTIQRGDDIAVGYFTKAMGSMLGQPLPLSQQSQPSQPSQPSQYGKPTPIPMATAVDLHKRK